MHATESSRDRSRAVTVTTRGFYHKMWDTQMGEETFADAGAMSSEQLRDKLQALRAEVQRLETEALKRGVGTLDNDR